MHLEFQCGDIVFETIRMLVSTQMFSSRGISCYSVQRIVSGQYSQHELCSCSCPSTCSLVLLPVQQERGVAEARDQPSPRPREGPPPGRGPRLCTLRPLVPLPDGPSCPRAPQPRGGGGGGGGGPGARRPVHGPVSGPVPGGPDPGSEGLQGPRGGSCPPLWV